MNLRLIKSEKFGEVQADIYSSGNEMYMTIDQLAECLEYSSRDAIEKMVARNPYLKNREFSVTDKLSATDGKMYNTRIFTEDGIYEVTMLSKTEKAKQFRAWVRRIIKSLRSGQATVLPTVELERMKVQASQDRARAMLLNAQNRTLKTIMSTMDSKLSPIAVEVFGLTTLEQLTGKPIDYRPECPKHYSATEIAKMAGVSPNRIGKLANQLGLKTEEYSICVMDKSPHSTKEVSAYRYNEKGLQRLLEAVKRSGEVRK